MKRNRPTSQPTLAAFGVKKFVRCNGEKVKIDLPLRAVKIAENYLCDFVARVSRNQVVLPHIRNVFMGPKTMVQVRQQSK